MKKTLIYIVVVSLVTALLSGCDFYETRPAKFEFLQSRENVEKVEICTNSEAYGWIEGKHVNSLETIAELPPEEIDEFWNALLEIAAVDVLRNTTGDMCGDLLFAISYANGQKELISFYSIGVVNADGTFEEYRLLAVEDSKALAQLFAKYADPKLLREVSKGFRSYY